ncbi:MAG: hypothetical protein ACREPX_13340 [Rhodanobacteraceae bacterium]
MTLSTPQRVGLFAILAIVMAATRVNHFAALPDATWAVFFVAGFYLRGSVRWAFPLLIALAVLIDFVVITGQGMNFWSHYCVSIAYWFLLPAYFAMWLAGSWLRSRYTGLGFRELGLAAVALLAAVSVCYVLSNGSYYWLSDTWMTAGKTRSFGGWLENLGDWYLPYLRTSAIYVGIAAALHVGTVLTARTIDGTARAADARSLRG